MKRVLIFILLVLSATLVSCTSNEKQNTTSIATTTPNTGDVLIDEEMIDYVDTLIEKTFLYIPYWNRESFKARWNYIDGVFLNSLINLYYNYKNIDNEISKKYMDFVIEYVNYYIDPNGNFVNPTDPSKLNYLDGELDSVCESRILFDLYDYTGDTRYLNAIEYTYNSLINMPLCEGTTNYWHKTSYTNQIWLDGMYMYAPFIVRYANLKNDASIYKSLRNQYQYIRENMFNEVTNLYYHGHDSTKSIFWADKTTGNSSSHWLRSIGWYIVSLVDVIEYYPDGLDKEYLIDIFEEAIEGVLEYQDQETKMFYQLVNMGKRVFFVPFYYLKNLGNKKYTTDAYISNYLESSGSSMIAYSLLKGSRLGYINAEYSSLGEATYLGIKSHSFKNNELHDICITAGLGPETKGYRDGSNSYYLAEPVGSDDAKGVGPFIMAFIENTFK